MSIAEDMANLDDALRNAGSGPQFDGDRSFLYPPPQWGDMLNERNHWKARCAVLEAQWNSIPWEDLEACVSIALMDFNTEMMECTSLAGKEASTWLDTHAPKGGTE